MFPANINTEKRAVTEYLKLQILQVLQWSIHNTRDLIQSTSDPRRKIAFMVCNMYMRSECNAARSSFMKDVAGYKSYYGGLMISYILCEQ